MGQEILRGNLADFGFALYYTGKQTFNGNEENFEWITLWYEHFLGFQCRFSFLLEGFM